MDFVTIHHAGLDRSACVPETAVPAFAERGWTTDESKVTADALNELIGDPTLTQDQHDDTSLTDASTQGSHDIKES